MKPSPRSGAASVQRIATREHEMQQFVMLDRFVANGLTTHRRRRSSAVNAHSANPHYGPLGEASDCDKSRRFPPARPVGEGNRGGFHLRRFHLGRVRRRDCARGAREDFFDRRQCARRCGRAGSQPRGEQAAGEWTRGGPRGARGYRGRGIRRALSPSHRAFDWARGPRYRRANLDSPAKPTTIGC